MTLKTVIVDEIHAVAPNKRGSHLTLSLERLDALATKKTGSHRPFPPTQRSHRNGPPTFSWARRGKPTIIDIGPSA